MIGNIAKLGVLAGGFSFIKKHPIVKGILNKFGLGGGEAKAPAKRDDAQVRKMHQAPQNQAAQPKKSSTEMLSTQLAAIKELAPQLLKEFGSVAKDPAKLIKLVSDPTALLSGEIVDINKVIDIILKHPAFKGSSRKEIMNQIPTLLKKVLSQNPIAKAMPDLGGVGDLLGALAGGAKPGKGGGPNPMDLLGMLGGMAGGGKQAGGLGSIMQLLAGAGAK